MKRGENRQSCSKDEGRDGQTGREEWEGRRSAEQTLVPESGSGRHAGRNAERATPPILGLKGLRIHVPWFLERIHSPS